MKEIQLTKGQVALVDDEDFEFINQWKWQSMWNESTKSYYAISKITVDKNKRKTIYMSRSIMKTPSDLVCDHINHNTLDNRKKNLRNITKSQNSMNSKTHKNNNVGEKGVIRSGTRFVAKVTIAGVCKYLGTYKTAEEASAAYKKHSKILFGEYFFKGNKD